MSRRRSKLKKKRKFPWKPVLGTLGGAAAGYVIHLLLVHTGHA